MTPRRPIPAALFAVGVCILATGCPQPAPQENVKTSSPRSETGLRLEKGFRKKLNAPATPEQEAVFTFLDEDRQRFQDATKDLKNDAQPGAVTKALAQYADQLDKADQAALPLTFKSALGHYQKAIRELVKVLARLPDGTFEGTQFYDSLFALLRGDSEKGKPLGGDVVKAGQEVRYKHNALYEAAGSFALDVDR